MTAEKDLRMGPVFAENLTLDLSLAAMQQLEASITSDGSNLLPWGNFRLASIS